MADTLKSGSVNICNFRSFSKQSMIHTLISRHKFDVFFIQESHILTASKLTLFKNMSQFWCGNSADARGVLSKYNLEHIFNDDDGRV